MACLFWVLILLLARLAYPCMNETPDYGALYELDEVGGDEE